MIKIYVLSDLVSGKVYIGQTKKTLKERFESHFSSRNCRAIFSSLKKFGKRNFEINLLAETNCKHNANLLEHYFIHKFNSLTPNGYNIREGGINGAMRSESKNKMSLSHKERLSKDPELLEKRLSNLKKSFGHLRGKPSKNRKAIICVNLNKLYESAFCAAKELNLDHSSVCAVARGRLKHTKGYCFVWSIE